LLVEAVVEVTTVVEEELEVIENHLVLLRVVIQ
jgi:hypothetical protein